MRQKHTVVVQLGRNGSVQAGAHLIYRGWTARVTKGGRVVDLTTFPVSTTCQGHILTVTKPMATLPWTDECQNKYQSKKRPKVRISFRVVGNLAYNDTILYLCWVRKSGRLHHFYKQLPPCGHHEEKSYVGHAFVLYRLPRDSKTAPETISDIKSEWMVAAFVPMAEGRHCLVVRLTLYPSSTPYTLNITIT